MKAGSSKVYKHPNADTLYLTVPSTVASDSTFPFKAGDEVSIVISDCPPCLIIAKEREKPKK